MSQINLSEIRKELSKIKDFESLKKEVKKLIAEIEKFDLKQSIPADKRKYIEKKYAEIMKTISGLQTSVEKEVTAAKKKVERTRKDAAKIITETREMALSQKKDLEKTLKKNFDYFKNIAQSSLKKEEKNIRKTIKKVRVQAVSTAKKTLNKKRKVTK
ncbi:MAG: hypothetical protein IT287_05460 [Bdellovibrionaceae bacterium]|nr:hypothetical protein [Pseudobdellovibrionaceae bacterium]